MRRRWIQSTCIILAFVITLILVIVLGTDQGEQNTSLQATGIPLQEKSPWDENNRQSEQSDISIGENETVYITEKGTKYHLYTDCSSLRRASNIEGVFLTKAQSKSRTLCKLCEKRKNEELKSDEK